MPVPPLVELTEPLVFVKFPAVEPVTETETEHEPPPVMEPPLRLMLLPPVEATGLPPQVFTIG